MTTHRHDEAITFVSWMKRALHIRRPRSQKGVAYCGLVVTRTALTVHEFTIEHPDEIPLEIRIERDFARLCSKCAHGFFNEVAADHASLRWSRELGTREHVPITWQVIYSRVGRNVVQTHTELQAVEADARRALPTTQEEQITRDELAREAEDEAREAIDAEAAEHALDDSLERSERRE